MTSRAARRRAAPEERRRASIVRRPRVDLERLEALHPPAARRRGPGGRTGRSTAARRCRGPTAGRRTRGRRAIAPVQRRAAGPARGRSAGRRARPRTVLDEDEARGLAAVVLEPHVHGEEVALEGARRQAPLDLEAGEAAARGEPRRGRGRAPSPRRRPTRATSRSRSRAAPAIAAVAVRNPRQGERRTSTQRGSKSTGTSTLRSTSSTTRRPVDALHAGVGLHLDAVGEDGGGEGLHVVGGHEARPPDGGERLRRPHEGQGAARARAEGRVRVPPRLGHERAARSAAGSRARRRAAPRPASAIRCSPSITGCRSRIGWNSRCARSMSTSTSRPTGSRSPPAS